ncbi:hypothetical protein ITP53_15590 [Nonomuraea sp. K274]|uniref:YtkA-like domain-containing protein n=1 Tax=Nonomuraea cypriaca TaxID=1187855 RepID=A0A931ABV1_9ACTN|nr:hypothetical protein [Nonomuraea cypriaca]MBF8187135.1 hypothetical protein [Nonomuraea cypriaca]
MTVVLAGLVLVLGAPAASAHEGPIRLELAGDGAHGVNVLVTWKKDGHPVEEIVSATLVATSSDGRSFGPVPLMSSPEGQNLYHAAEPLPSGEWRVTATATKPSKARTTVKVTARDLAAAPVAVATPLVPGPKAAAPVALVDDEDPMGMPLKIGIIAVAAAIAIAAWIGLARRRGRYGRR